MAHTSNFITRGVAYALLCGFIIWVVLLMHASFSVRDLAVRKVHTVVAFNLKLHTIQKIPSARGYSIHISLERGLVWYGLSWVGTGIGGGLFFSTLRSKHNDE